MKTINRSAITIIPKKLCMDWANSFDDGPGGDFLQNSLKKSAIVKIIGFQTSGGHDLFPTYKFTLEGVLQTTG